ncbi:MAG: dihydropteroate synthase [Chloroflexota bacterium]
MAALSIPLARTGVLRCRGRDLEYGKRTLVMGIVNVTPDSFSGDGLDRRIDLAVAQASRMVADGADLIDVGGESTNPRARPVEDSEERARVVPTVAALVAALTVPISVDTRKSGVAEAALSAGAHLINDVTGLRDDPGLAVVAARHGAPIILMHSPGEAWDVKWPAAYSDVVAEVRDFLARSIGRATGAGVPFDQIVVDPGFGFGKSDRDNLEILRRLGEFRELGTPVLIGTSRKSTLGRLLGLPVEERLEASLATLPLAVAQGADVVRVHDVRQSSQVVRVADAIVRGRA